MASAPALETPLWMLGARLAGIDDRAGLDAAQSILGQAGWGHRDRGRSVINNDGSALQLCVSFLPQERSIRLLADPTAFIDWSRPENRTVAYEVAQRALSRAMDFANCTSLRWGCDKVVNCFQPRDFSSANRPSGLWWLAVGLASSGMALYANARGGQSHEWWPRLLKYMRQSLPGNEGYELMLNLMPHAFPASVGIEGTSEADARIKIYWRLRRPTALLDLGCTLFVDEALLRFLEMILDQQSIGVCGLVFSAGLGFADGQLRDIKIDVCGHCVQISENKWLGACQLMGLSEALVSDVKEILRGGLAEIAVIGFGVERQGRRRLNLYLKSPNQ